MAELLTLRSCGSCIFWHWVDGGRVCGVFQEDAPSGFERRCHIPDDAPEHKGQEGEHD